MSESVKTLTEEEIKELGIEVPDYRPPQEFDGRGREVISYAQFLYKERAGERLDNFMLRMKGPTGTGLVQASKINKYIGQGFVPLEVAERREKMEAGLLVKNPGEKGVDPEGNVITIYRCSEKYPECERFFDRPRARETHWGMEHEQKLKKRAKGI